MDKFNLNNMTYEQLKAECKRLEGDLHRIRPIIAAYENAQNSETQAVLFVGDVAETSNDSSLTELTVYDAAVKLLEEEGTKLNTKGILERFSKRGKVSESTNPMVNLYNGLDGALKKPNCKIIKLGNGYWGLKDRDEKHLSFLQ